MGNHISFSNYYDENQKLRILKLNDFLEFGKEVIYEPHRLDFFAVILVTKGISKHIIGHQQVEVGASEMLLISARQLHYFVRDLEVDGFVLSFSDDFFMGTLKREYIYEIDELLSRFHETMKYSLCQSTNKEFVSLMELIYLYSHHHNKESQLIILENLLTIFLHAINRLANNTANKSVVNYNDHHRKLALLFRVLVKNNIVNEQNLNFYLQKLSVSQTTLQIATKQTFNQSPKEILIQHLIALAKFKLMDPTQKIQHIATSLGFNQATNFTKFFKKYTDLTPAEYRKSLV